MIRIVVNAEQAKAIAETGESVEIVDAKGNRLGYLSRPFSQEDIQLARERLASNQERRPSSAVFERLKSLEGK